MVPLSEPDGFMPVKLALLLKCVLELRPRPNSKFEVIPLSWPALEDRDFVYDFMDFETLLEALE